MKQTTSTFAVLFYGIFLASFLLLSQAIQAEEPSHCDDLTESCIETGKWNFAVSIGVGLRSNPLVDSDNIPLVLLPEFSYYSDNFFIENLDFGYTLFDSTEMSFNLIATPSYDSVFFKRWDPGNLLVNLTSGLNANQQLAGQISQLQDRATEINPSELSNRNFSYLGGIEYSKQYNNSSLQLSILSDITNTHSGNEIRAAYAYSFNKNIRATFGFTWKDSKLTDYYYGIAPEEIVDDRGVYDASSSFNPFIRITFDERSKSDSDWRFSFEYQKLDRQISNSPILNDDYVITFYAGKRFRL